MFHQTGHLLRFNFKGKKLVFQFRQRRIFNLCSRASLCGSRLFLAHMFLARMFLARMFLARMLSGSRRLHRDSAMNGLGRLRGCGRSMVLALLPLRRRGRSADLRVRVNPR